MNGGDQLPSGPVSRQGWRLALAAFGRALLRLLALLIAGGILAAIIIWGVPALTRRLIVPVEENRARLERFQAGQEEANQQLNRRLDRLQEELGTLEAGRAQDAQAITELKAQLVAAQETLAVSISNTQSDLEALLPRLEAFDQSIEEIDTNLSALATAQRSDREALRTITAEKKAADVSLEALRREIQMLKAMELLIRSRLFLMQSNFGLARDDLLAARNLLAGLETQVPPYQADALRAILARLDLALGNLPERPVLAADDLEIAWELLVLGLPDEAQATAAAAPRTATFTPTFTAWVPISGTLTSSPTISATLSITRTPTLGVTATLTPSRTPAGDTPTPSP